MPHDSQKDDGICTNIKRKRNTFCIYFRPRITETNQEPPNHFSNYRQPLSKENSKTPTKSLIIFYLNWSFKRILLTESPTLLVMWYGCYRPQPWQAASSRGRSGNLRTSGLLETDTLIWDLTSAWIHNETVSLHIQRLALNKLFITEILLWSGSQISVKHRHTISRTALRMSYLTCIHNGQRVLNGTNVQWALGR